MSVTKIAITRNQRTICFVELSDLVLKGEGAQLPGLDCLGATSMILEKLQESLLIELGTKNKPLHRAG